MVKRSREDLEPSRSSTSQSPPESSGTPYLSDAPSNSSADAREITKILHIDSESGEDHRVVEVMRCSLPPHRQPITFSTYEEYEIHYNKAHVNRCLECQKNFPTEHFLNLHLAENHNPLAEVLKDRGERTYACFVEDCDKVCLTPQKRRLHLIDKHMFPKNYDFHVVNDGIDQRSSMLRVGRHRRKSSAVQHKMEIDARARQRTTAVDNDKDNEVNPEPAESTNITFPDKIIQNPPPASDEAMEGLTGAMSALKFVPPSIRFGRGGKGKGGFSRS